MNKYALVELPISPFSHRRIVSSVHFSNVVSLQRLQVIHSHVSDKRNSQIVTERANLTTLSKWYIRIEGEMKRRMNIWMNEWIKERKKRKKKRKKEKPDLGGRRSVCCLLRTCPSRFLGAQRRECRWFQRRVSWKCRWWYRWSSVWRPSATGCSRRFL